MQKKYKFKTISTGKLLLNYLLNLVKFNKLLKADFIMSVSQIGLKTTLIKLIRNYKYNRYRKKDGE